MAAAAPGGKRTDNSMVGQGSGETGELGDGSAMDGMLRMGFDKETAEKALKVGM